MKTYNNPENLKKWLAKQLDFHQYSAMNRMLIYSQNPQAQFVQSYTKWKELGYPPTQKGSGIPIFRPNIVMVYKTADGTEKYWKYASEEDRKKYKPYKKQYGYNLTYVFDISATEATEDILLDRVESKKKCQKEDLAHMYQQLSEQTDIVSNSQSLHHQIYDVVKEYVRERLLEKYAEKTEVKNYADLITEADTYCILSQYPAIQQELLDYSSLNHTWKEDDIKTLQKVNQVIGETSYQFLAEVSSMLED